MLIYPSVFDWPEAFSPIWNSMISIDHPLGNFDDYSVICTPSLRLLELLGRIKWRSRRDWWIEEWKKKEGRVNIS